MSKTMDEMRRLLVGENIDEWQCPDCGSLSYTHKDQKAVLVHCSHDHDGKLVWMKKVKHDTDAE